jgi:RNA polymerase sigma-70 factor (family 1)
LRYSICNQVKDTIVNELRRGSHEAYCDVYDDYHVKLYQYVLRYTGSSYLAEETVQLSFIKLWEKREGLSDDYPVSIQLFRIAKSTLIDLLRKEGLRKTQELQDTIVPETFSERIIQKEELGQVLSAIEELPQQSRRVFELSRMEEMSHKEISHLLSISTKTIEGHITKAIKYIRSTIAFF